MSAVHNVVKEGACHLDASSPSRIAGAGKSPPEQHASQEEATATPPPSVPEAVSVAQLVPRRVSVRFQEPKVSVPKYFARVFASCIATGVIFSAVVVVFAGGESPIPGIEQPVHA